MLGIASVTSTWAPIVSLIKAHPTLCVCIFCFLLLVWFKFEIQQIFKPHAWQKPLLPVGTSSEAKGCVLPVGTFVDNLIKKCL